MKTASLIIDLWQRAAPNLTEEELRQFSQCTESASFLLQNLEDVVNGVGCFVCNDDVSKVGSFTSSDGASTLLFHISETISQARALVEIGDDAKTMLMQRMKQKQRD